MQSYQLNDFVICDDAVDLQLHLSKAHNRLRPICLCRFPHVQNEMTIAKINSSEGLVKYILKRLPDKGKLHAPDCKHHEQPEGISGFEALRGTAVQFDEHNSIYKLKLGFALSQKDKVPKYQDEDKSTANFKPIPADKNLSPLAFLHHLWEQADLNRMHGGMQTKRTWQTVHRLLNQKISSQITSRYQLSDMTYVPSTFFMDHKEALSTAYNTKRYAAQKHKQALLIISEITAFENNTVKFKHVPTSPFLISAAILPQINRRLTEARDLQAVCGESHIIGFGAVFINNQGVANLRELAIMNVTKYWIPFTNMAEFEFLTILDQSGRHYRKSLHYGEKSAISTAVLIDTDDTFNGTACFVMQPEDVYNHHDVMNKLKLNNLDIWQWDISTAMPALPKKVFSSKPIKV